VSRNNKNKYNVLFLDHTRQFHELNKNVKLSMFLLTQVSIVPQEQFSIYKHNTQTKQYA